MNPRQDLKSYGYDDQAIDRFMAYHNTNPDVWRLFEATAKKLLSENRKRIGAKMIAEQMRWFSAAGAGTYKVNNNYTAMYARVFAAKYPQFKSRIEMREVHGLQEPVQTSLELRGGL